MFSCTTGEKLSSWCLCSAVPPAVWYCMCIYRQSHPVISSFKTIQMTENTPPQHQGATLHTLMFPSRNCEGAYVTYTSVQIRWRNSGNWRNQTCSLNTSKFPVWLNAPAASAYLRIVPPKKHRHWAMTYTTMQTPFVTSHAIVSRTPIVLLGEWVE